MKTRYVVLVGVGAALVLVVSAVAGPLVRDGRYGVVYQVPATRDSLNTVVANVGDRFSVAVRDNNAAGDDWWLKRKPEYAVAELVHDEYVAQTSADLTGAGRHFYTFLAKAPSTSDIVLVNMNTFTATVHLTIR
jgi:hypothetical protein